MRISIYRFSSGPWEFYLNKQFGYSKTSFQINSYISLGHKALYNFKFYVLFYQEEEEIEVLCCGLFVQGTLKTLEPNFSLNTEICFSKQIFSILSINFLMPNISTIILMSFHASSLQPPNSFLWVNWITCSFVGSNLKTGSWTVDMVYGKYWMKYGQSFRNINPRLCLSTFQLHSYIKLVTVVPPLSRTHYSLFQVL